MIRPITPDDAEAVAELTVTSELFSAEEAEIVKQMMADYFADKNDDGHTCIVDEEHGQLLAVAYYEPMTATDRTWELTMLGVRRDHHRQGRGATLLRHVEQELRARNQRLLLIETSALPAFERARTFYLACGYDEEARVRDYYESGDDMVLFRKALLEPSGRTSDDRRPDRTPPAARATPIGSRNRP